MPSRSPTATARLYSMRPSLFARGYYAATCRMHTPQRIVSLRNMSSNRNPLIRDLDFYLPGEDGPRSGRRHPPRAGEAVLPRLDGPSALHIDRMVFFGPGDRRHPPCAPSDCRGPDPLFIFCRMVARRPPS